MIETTGLGYITDALHETALAGSGRFEGSIVVTEIEGQPPGTTISIRLTGEFDDATGVSA